MNGSRCCAAISAAVTFMFLLLVVPAHAAGAGSKVGIVIMRTPALGFYDVGTDFADHTDADAHELERHRGHGMSFSDVPLDQRRKLQEELPEAEAAAAEKAFHVESPEIVEWNNAEDGALAPAVLSPQVVSWKGSAAAPLLADAFAKTGAERLVLVQVDEVSHNTGRFIRPKALAHYFCVDSQLEGRIATADGRLLPVRKVRVCKAEVFHPAHTEDLEETSRRQSESLSDAFHRLARLL